MQRRGAWNEFAKTAQQFVYCTASMNEELLKQLPPVVVLYLAKNDGIWKRGGHLACGQIEYLQAGVYSKTRIGLQLRQSPQTIRMQQNQQQHL